MKRTSRLPQLLAGLGIFMLILDGKTVLAGAAQGVVLCLQTVIPALFPFFVLSIYLTRNAAGRPGPLLRSLGRFLGMPPGAEGLLIPGFLGGYPVGAQAVAEAWRSGRLSQAQARHLMMFCSNPGPAFLFGMVASYFSKGWMVLAMWGILLLSAAITALIARPGEDGAVSIPAHSKITLPQALSQAVQVMALVCGWVVLFRGLLAFLSRWVLWLLPVPAQVAAAGLLELSNGCCLLDAIADEQVRFCLCCTLLAFGGVCVTMQTASVSAGLPIRWYLLGKGIQAGLCLVFSWAIFQEFGALILGSALLAALILGKRRNCSSNRQLVGV